MFKSRIHIVMVIPLLLAGAVRLPAQTVPANDFLGIEVSRKYARFTAARLAKAECTNAKIVHGDGVRIFHELLPDRVAAAVHVYFPDPWWKARHKKRRVMNESFVGDVQRVLVDGGTLHFWTDVKEYFDSTLALLRDATDLTGPVIPQQQTAEHDMDFRTHFERRTRLNNQPVYRAVFRKD